MESAKEAGLRYVTDTKPGIQRKKSGTSFRYLLPDGKTLRDHNELVRVKRLVIPPAWTGVWICPSPNGHLQATGRDARGRKQYRYHARWRTARDETKYDRMITFGHALPKIRQRVKRDLKLQGVPREKVLATVVALLEKSLIRVGNEEYAKENNSFGLTTMRNRHVEVKGAKVSFEFRGKSGVKHEINVTDPVLAKIVRKCRDLPGYELFQYEDENGELKSVDSADVNQYLREITGEEFTAKDFRTWAGTVLAAIALREFEKFDSQAEAKRNIVTAVQSVAKLLGNTPTVCKKCYVHPVVLDTYLDGSMIDTFEQRADEKIRTSLRRLKPHEAAVMVLLRSQLAHTKAGTKVRKVSASN
ncbi:MAG: DNA topoisomerase IB [Verrucomicrobiota bacterium]|nr:DNA topoisomerase IB [Verrucomicrobiota bacterium]